MKEGYKMACSCPLFSTVQSSKKVTACGTFGCNGNSGRQKKTQYEQTYCKVWLSDVVKVVQCNKTTIGCCG